MTENYKIQTIPECCSKCKFLLGWNYGKNGFMCAVQSDQIDLNGKCDKYAEKAVV